jgi:hypothetical protein
MKGATIMDIESLKTNVNKRFAEQQQTLNNLLLRIEKRSRNGLFLALLISTNVLLVIGLIVLLTANSTVPSGYLYIGNQRQLLVNQVIAPSQQLIPKGLVLEENEINEYVFEFSPVFEDAATLTIQVVDASRKIGDINNPFNDLLMIQLYNQEEPLHEDNVDLIEVDLAYDVSLEQYTHLVYAKVFLGVPDINTEQEAYEAISGKKVSFSLLFQITHD